MNIVRHIHNRFTLAWAWYLPLMAPRKFARLAFMLYAVEVALRLAALIIAGLLMVLIGEDRRMVEEQNESYISLRWKSWN